MWDITLRKKNLSVRYELEFVEYGISLGEFKVETNCKCPLELSVNINVKFKGLV